MKKIAANRNYKKASPKTKSLLSKTLDIEAEMKKRIDEIILLVDSWKHQVSMSDNVQGISDSNIIKLEGILRTIKDNNPLGT